MIENVNHKELLARDIGLINQLPAEEQRYLYGYCYEWCQNNFKDGMEIVSIMERDNHENGMVHSYLRNPNTGFCYDVRGEYRSDEEIIRYTGVDYLYEVIEEYIFNSVEEFDEYLKWVDFEIVKDEHLIRY